MQTPIYDKHGSNIGYLENDANGGISAFRGSTRIARYDLVRNITENYINGDRDTGDMLLSSLREYNLSSR